MNKKLPYIDYSIDGVKIVCTDEIARDLSFGDRFLLNLGLISAKYLNDKYCHGDCFDNII